jgi:PhnB protein
MAENSADPQVIPYLLYADVASALDWLTEAFGFHERMRVPAEDGSINHAEMTLDSGGVIMLGDPGPDYRNPKQLGHHTQLQYIRVDDVDAHFAQAKAGGAVITAELEDKSHGTRSYIAEDPEGHQWSFYEPVT